MPAVDAARLAGLLERAPLAGLAGIAAGHPSRVALVGGAVRDTLLGLPVRDLDLAVEGGLDEFLDAVEAQVGRRPSPIGDRFQDTHRFRRAGVQVDVARSLGTIEEDLGRRDFSVNAMAMPLAVEPGGAPVLIDPHGGCDDLVAGRLRETATGVIAADPLRALRAVRYAVSLPGFDLEEATRATVADVAPSLDGVASERKVAEWAEILQLAAWHEGLELARATGVAAHALGPLDGLDAVAAWAAGEGPGAVDARARLAALVTDLARARPLEQVLTSLREGRWPRSLVAHAGRVARWSEERGADVDALARRALEDPAAAADAAELRRREGRGDPESERLAGFAARACEDRWVRGADLVELGMSPGPALGDLLETLAVGQVTRRWGGAEEARAWARDEIAAGGAEGR